MEARVAALIASPTGLQIVKDLIEDVQQEVEPAEADISPGFIEPLLETIVDGEIVRFDSSNEAGRFGGGDFMFVVIVALVVSALEKLLARLSVSPPEEPVSDSLVNEIVTPDEVRRIVRLVGSIYARTQVDALTRALRRSLAARMENLRRMER
jgi:hypothetical protein